LRREGAALASDAEVVSRANEALDERCTTLNARMEAMERELEELRPLEREVASLREWKKSQANDLKEAMEVLGHV
jgi:predicted  nucleic acid-binding Zn-ribbon protein